MLKLFSDWKSFDQDQKLNRRNNSRLCASPAEVHTAMHTKFPSSEVVFGVLSMDGHVIPPHLFPQGIRIHAITYIKMLDTVVKPRTEGVTQGRP